uniref:MCAfunc domain-containing protein n=1 Tax=Oryza punctata TaxID=4537 RepID=A0A0E0ML17_ORYPU
MAVITSDPVFPIGDTETALLLVVSYILALSMADPVSSLKHITQMALKIKEAVDTVRRNKEDCLQIRRRVVRVSDILSQLQETGNIMSNPAMSAALEDLSETLRHAHTLVVSCQERNVVCLLCAATALSKKLRRVNDDISDQMMVGIFVTTVHVTIALSQIQGDVQYDVMYARRRTEITDDFEVTLPKKEEPKPPPPPMEAVPEPEPPLPPPEEPTPLLPLQTTPRRRKATMAVECHPSPEKEPTPPSPREKPEATLVLEFCLSLEEEPTPPLSPQFGGVPAPEYSGRSRPARMLGARQKIPVFKSKYMFHAKRIKHGIITTYFKKEEFSKTDLNEVKFF